MKIAHELSKNLYNFDAISHDCPKTSLDAIADVDLFKTLVKWLLIGSVSKIYAPVRYKNEYLGVNASATEHNKKEKRINDRNFNGHAFYIKDISNLAKTYA